MHGHVERKVLNARYVQQAWALLYRSVCTCRSLVRMLRSWLTKGCVHKDMPSHS